VFLWVCHARGQFPKVPTGDSLAAVARLRSFAFKRYSCAPRKAGTEDFHFHDLRHPCAIRLGDRGASALEIAQIMGWSAIRIAMRYTHVTGDGIRRAMELLTHTGVGRGKVLQLRFQYTNCPHVYRHKSGGTFSNE
jgi:hypothetical protein